MYEQKQSNKARMIGYGIGLAVVAVLIIGKLVLKF
jgi:hypothetical protein